MTAPAAAPDGGRLLHGWVVARVMFAALAMVFGARFAVGLFLPFLPEAPGSTTSAVSGAIALSMPGAGLLHPAVGGLPDRARPRVWLLAGQACAGGCSSPRPLPRPSDSLA
jgi:hypothetical protein